MTKGWQTADSLVWISPHGPLFFRCDSWPLVRAAVIGLGAKVWDRLGVAGVHAWPKRSSFVAGAWRESRQAGVVAIRRWKR